MNRTILLTIGLLTFFLFFGCATVPTTEEKTSAEGPDFASFYPSPPDEPRLQFLKGFTREDDLFKKKQSALDRFLLGDQSSGKAILRPWDIASSKGKIYVVDRTLMKLVTIDLVAQKFVLAGGALGSTLPDPTGIWVTEDEIKYVADKGKKQVVVFGKNNELLRAYGKKGLFEKPLDVAVYGNSVYVIDMAKNQLFVLLDYINIPKL